MPPVPRASRGPGWSWAIAPAALLGCFAWSYWPILAELRVIWAQSEDYSVGQLVPFAAAYLVWRDRAFFKAAGLRPSAWGFAVLGLAEIMRVSGAYLGYGSATRYALVASVAGTIWLAVGWRAFRRLAPVWLFLLLMFPLPARIHESVALPLQHWATVMAAFLLELSGFFVVREGEVLHLDNQTTVAVSEACSGLRMLTAFVFVTATLAFMLQRPRWQKIALIACSIPIAVLSNGARGAATAVLAGYLDNRALTSRFHDLAGLAMMPVALLMCWGLLKFLALFQPGEGTPAAALAAATKHARARTDRQLASATCRGGLDHRPTAARAARSAKS